MTDIDLNALSLAELKQLEKNVAKAIASFEDRRKAEARAAAEAVAKEHGFALGDLVDATSSRKRAPSAPKYRHPDNPNNPNRGGSVFLNRFGAFFKWISASIMPPPLRASAG